MLSMYEYILTLHFKCCSFAMLFFVFRCTYPTPIDFEDPGAYNKVDFDKILQSLVMSLEHPDPFVRKVGMYWMKKVSSQ